MLHHLPDRDAGPLALREVLRTFLERLCWYDAVVFDTPRRGTYPPVGGAITPPSMRKSQGDEATSGPMSRVPMFRPRPAYRPTLAGDTSTMRR